MGKKFSELATWDMFKAHGTLWLKVTPISAKDLRKRNGYGTCDFLNDEKDPAVDPVDVDELVASEMARLGKA